MKATLLLLLLAIFTPAQCDHTSGRMSRFNNDRFAPAMVKNFDGHNVEWIYFDDVGDYRGTFTVDDKTIFPQGFAATYKNNFFWVIYSDCDKYAHAIYVPTDEQIKEFKRFVPRK